MPNAEYIFRSRACHLSKTFELIQRAEGTESPIQFSCKRLADYKSERPICQSKLARGLALLILFCLLCRQLSADECQAQTARGTAAAQNAAIVSTTDAVLKETSELRELSILRDVKSGAQSRADIERMIVKNLDADTTPAEMHADRSAAASLWPRA